MALVLNTNSYVEIADADGYLETRIDSANWFNATDEIREQALVTATQIVDDHPGLVLLLVPHKLWLGLGKMQLI